MPFFNRRPLKKFSFNKATRKAAQAAARGGRVVAQRAAYRRVPRPGELKFFDTAIDFQFDNTGEVPASGQLNLIPQGVTQSTRIGRACTIKSLQLKARVLYTPTTDTVGAQNAYLYLVLDTQANGAAAAATAVLTSADFTVALTNLENSDRFKILKKWTWSLNAQAGVSAAYARTIRHLDYYKKLNTQIIFDSTAATGAIATIRSNNIFLLAGSSIGDDDTQFIGTCRLRFADD